MRDMSTQKLSDQDSIALLRPYDPQSRCSRASSQHPRDMAVQPFGDQTVQSHFTRDRAMPPTRPPGPIWLLVLMIAMASNGRTLADQPAASVVVDAVRLETVEQWRQVTGELVSLRRAQIAAEEPGLVLELLVEAGDAVEGGTVIARLDATLATLAATQATERATVREGVVDQRIAELDRATRELARYRSAAIREGASVSEIDDAETRVSIIEAQLAQARAEMLVAEAAASEARTRVEKMVIKAPFSGRVITKLTERGQWLDRGDTIIELVSLKAIEARLDVPERLVTLMRRSGVRVRVVIDAVRLPTADDPLHLVPFDKLLPITAIIPQVDTRSRLFPIRVWIPNPGELVQPGMSVVGMVPVGQKQLRLTIHKDAILRDDAGEFVYFDAGGMAMPARVRTRFAVGDRVVIDAGVLNPGMSVIIEGNERLYPSERIEIISTTISPPASSEEPGTTDAGAASRDNEAPS